MAKKDTKLPKPFQKAMARQVKFEKSISLYAESRTSLSQSPALSKAKNALVLLFIYKPVMISFLKNFYTIKFCQLFIIQHMPCAVQSNNMAARPQCVHHLHVADLSWQMWPIHYACHPIQADQLLLRSPYQ